MSLVGFLIVCLLVGAGLYLLKFAPIDETVKQVVRVVVIVLLIIYAILIIAAILGNPTGMPSLRGFR